MVTPVEAWEVWVGSMFAALIVAGICRELASSPPPCDADGAEPQVVRHAGRLRRAVRRALRISAVGTSADGAGGASHRGDRGCSRPRGAAAFPSTSSAASTASVSISSHSAANFKSIRHIVSEP